MEEDHGQVCTGQQQLNANDPRSNPACHFILVVVQEILDQVLAISISSVRIGSRLDKPPEKFLIAE
jgi:hypothetical protein